MAESQRVLQRIYHSLVVSSPPMRILHIAAPAPVGGLERVVQALAAGHQRLGHDVHVAAVLAADSLPHPFLDLLEDDGVTVHPIVVRGRGWLQERRAIHALCRAMEFDVVHTHGYRPDILDAGVARSLGIPTVTTVHGSSRQGGLTTIYEWLEERSFRLFEAVIAVSQPVARSVVDGGVAEHKVHLVRNAWSAADPFLNRYEARRALGLDQEETLIGWVGRMIPAKGPDIFVQAMQGLADLPVRGVMIGDGPQRQSLEAVDSTIRFVGALDHAAPYFKAFDAFVLSSRTEGTPIVLLEAMAAGVPIIATRVGGVPDIIGDEEAVTVPSEDVRAMADAIRDVVASPEPARRRADAARKRGESAFALEPWLNRHIEIYRDIQRYHVRN